VKNMTKVFAVAVAAVLMAGNALAAAECDLALGEKTFKKCKACHKLEEGKKAIGPHLFGIVGRHVASVEGYKYSKAMRAFGEPEDRVWDVETLDTYLKKPKKLVKGTKMSFGGLRKDAKRAALICYLETIK